MNAKEWVGKIIENPEWVMCTIDWEAIDEICELVYKVPENEWIPVEERLPKDNQVVLTCKNRNISILEYHADTKHWYETKGNWWWSFSMVDAWMPLPNKYVKE